MSLSDPIGDMIARIKNAQNRNHKKVLLPSSKFKEKIAQVLKTDEKIFLNVFKIYADTKMDAWLNEIKAPSLVLTGADLQDKDIKFLKGETEKIIQKTDDTVISITEEINNWGFKTIYTVCD